MPQREFVVEKQPLVDPPAILGTIPLSACFRRLEDDLQCTPLPEETHDLKAFLDGYAKSLDLAELREILPPIATLTPIDGLPGLILVGSTVAPGFALLVAQTPLTNAPLAELPKHEFPFVSFRLSGGAVTSSIFALGLGIALFPELIDIPGFTKKDVDRATHVRVDWNSFPIHSVYGSMVLEGCKDAGICVLGIDLPPKLPAVRVNNELGLASPSIFVENVAVVLGIPANEVYSHVFPFIDGGMSSIFAPLD